MTIAIVKPRRINIHLTKFLQSELQRLAITLNRSLEIEALQRFLGHGLDFFQRELFRGDFFNLYGWYRLGLGQLTLVLIFSACSGFHFAGFIYAKMGENPT